MSLDPQTVAGETNIWIIANLLWIIPAVFLFWWTELRPKPDWQSKYRLVPLTDDEAKARTSDQRTDGV